MRWLGCCLRAGAVVCGIVLLDSLDVFDRCRLAGRYDMAIVRSITHKAVRSGQGGTAAARDGRGRAGEVTPFLSFLLYTLIDPVIVVAVVVGSCRLRRRRRRRRRCFLLLLLLCYCSATALLLLLLCVARCVLIAASSYVLRPASCVVVYYGSGACWLHPHRWQQLSLLLSYFLVLQSRAGCFLFQLAKARR